MEQEKELIYFRFVTVNNVKYIRIEDVHEIIRLFASDEGNDVVYKAEEFLKGLK